MPSLGQNVKVPIAERLEHPYFLKGDETGKAKIADDLIQRFQTMLVPSLKKIESREVIQALIFATLGFLAQDRSLRFGDISNSMNLRSSNLVSNSEVIES